MKPVQTVLVVEDESLIAELISVNLRHNGFRPIWAMDGTSAQREIDARVPDLILLDWMLPGESGLLLAQRWRSDPRLGQVPIIMLTARSEEPDRVAGLDAGADDYISKPFSAREMLARVRAVLRRTLQEQAPEQLALGPIQMDTGTYRVLVEGKSVKLGPTEFKLLQYLLRSPERVHTRAHLLDSVWGDHVYIGERTVDVHIKRLRQSLKSAGAQIETVRSMGYRLTAHPVDGATTAAPTAARTLSAAYPSSTV